MASRRQGHMLETGEKAPDFRLPALSGNVDAHRGKERLLVFFKVSCPTCQFALPFIERLHASGAVPVIAISQDDAESTREFHAEFGITIPTLLDSEDDYPVSNAYRITNVPSLFLVGSDDVVLWSMHGFGKSEYSQLAARFGVALFRPDDYVPEWKAG